MTATRWWVQMGARWVARVEAVAPIIRMGMLTMTGLSTALIGLKQYGYSQFAEPLIAVVAIATLVFTWYYTEGGVWNQKNRDKQDMGTNFAGPTMRMDDELIARGILAGERGRPLNREERHAIKAELDDAFDEYRDGIPLEECA